MYWIKSVLICMIIVHTEIGPVGSPSLNCLDFTESREHSDPIWTLVHFLLLPQEIHTLFYFPSYFSPLLSSSPPLTKIAVSLLTVIISPHLEILDTFHLPRRAPTLLPLSTPLSLNACGIFSLTRVCRESSSLGAYPTSFKCVT